MTDAIIIGGGHNGLVAGAYLARAGLDVVVCEKRDALGGLASTYELAPGFRASVGPELSGLLRPEVVDDLELLRHGLERVPLDPVAYHPSGLALWRDTAKTVEAIRKVSAKDAEAYPRFIALVSKLTGFLKPLMRKPAPTPDIRKPGDFLDMLKLGWGFKRLGTRPMHELLRILPMALWDFLGEWFESDALKALLAGAALEGIRFGPKAAGTSALFLYRRLGDDPMLARNRIAALEASFRAAGGAVRTGAAVSRIRVENGRALGVELESGESLEASQVLSTVSPQRTFLELTGPTELEPSFVAEIERIRYRGVTAKLDLALSSLDGVDFPGGVLQIGSDLEYLERASDAPKYGEASERPFLRAVVPTFADPSLAPEGKHVLSALVQYVPYGATLDPRSVIAELPIDGDSVLHHRLWTPSDYERELGLSEGSLHHGEMALDQMFFMRPVPEWSHYETPVEGLYLGGPGAHPGGGFTGAPGRNAAKALLSARG